MCEQQRLLHRFHRTADVSTYDCKWCPSLGQLRTRMGFLPASAAALRVAQPVGLLLGTRPKEWRTT